MLFYRLVGITCTVSFTDILLTTYFHLLLVFLYNFLRIILSALVVTLAAFYVFGFFVAFYCMCPWQIYVYRNMYIHTNRIYIYMYMYVYIYI